MGMSTRMMNVRGNFDKPTAPLPARLGHFRCSKLATSANADVFLPVRQRPWRLGETINQGTVGSSILPASPSETATPWIKLRIGSRQKLMAPWGERHLKLLPPFP